jgi:hypothetical protein
MAGGVLIGLTPLATGLVGLADEAQTHIFAEAPSFGELVRALQLPAVGAVSAISWLVSRVLRGSGAPTLRSDQVLIAAWWLGPPLLLWLLAQTAEVNLFVPRYFATAAAGMALAGAYAAAASIPASYLRHTGAVLGVAILVLSFVKAPPSREASWRDAAKLVSQWSSTPSVILCPSGFIEAQPPEWSETYSLPGFLYAPLDAYPVPGDRLLLPTREARQPVELVEARVRTAAARGESILIYGGASAAGFWVEWLDDHAELAGWHREVKMFGSVTAARYSK